jgi:predicted lipoprotein with Yx(FWY)xxD motif
MRMRAMFFVLLALAAVSASSAAFASSQTSRPTLRTGSSSYGRVLFDGRGFVVYAFTRDPRGKSVCTGACTKAWPPYVVKTRLRAASGVKARLLGTTRRVDGSLQVTYAGRALYYYVGDRSKGQILCHNVTEFGGLWRVIRPSGTPVR